jgi:hypothetical protein
MFNRMSNRIAALSLIALILIATGCSTSVESPNNPVQSTLTDPVTASDSASITNDPANDAKEVVEPAEQSGKKDLTISSPEIVNKDPFWEDPDSDAASVNEKSEPAKLQNYDVTEPFDQARLTLMGFSIHDSADALIARFGQPTTETFMKDGTETLTVLVYPGFNFGVNASKSIVFIEVTSEMINPGLNTFRIGQTIEEAQKALGPADSLNDFVMIYEKDSLTLKCDLDPNNRTVISIKLFAS